MSARTRDHASLSQDKKKTLFSDRSENFRALIPPRELSKTDEKVGVPARGHAQRGTPTWCNFGFLDASLEGIYANPVVWVRLGNTITCAFTE